MHEKNQIFYQSKNCRPISSLPICCKSLERILLKSAYEFLEENNILRDHQSGFRLLDSCEYQFLSIMCRIYLSFECKPHLDIKGAFFGYI